MRKKLSIGYFHARRSSLSGRLGPFVLVVGDLASIRTVSLTQVRAMRRWQFSLPFCVGKAFSRRSSSRARNRTGRGECLVSKKENEGGTEVADGLREFTWNLPYCRHFGGRISNVGFTAYTSFIRSLLLTSSK